MSVGDDPATGPARRVDEGWALGDSEFCLVLDDDGRIAGCNAPYARWLGFAGCAELLGRPFAATLDAASRAKFDLAWGDADAASTRLVELNHRGPDARFHLGKFQIYPRRSLGPDQGRVVLLGSDAQGSIRLLEELIDLKREREHQLSQVHALNARLERQNADLAALSHMVKHDVSNSLNAIHLTGALLEQLGASDPELVEQSARDIGGLCMHIAGMLNGFVSLADVARRPLAPSRVDLDEAARAMVDLVAARRPDVPHRAEFDLRARSVRADPNHVRQVFENLVSNAFKYRDPARAPLVVRISSRARGDEVAVEVADNALGIPADRQATIFDLFTRAHVDAAEGHGVGLAIVRRLVEANGGAVSLESREGVGTTFRITWPADRP